MEVAFNADGIFQYSRIFFFITFYKNFKKFNIIKNVQYHF